MHKFTMQDAKHSQPHREVATDIEIQQSQSYEIKETDFMPDFHRGKLHHQQQHHSERYEDPVPVIVLRIPGPQKYAVHLQALLQQYLEMRAAMYIHALEEEERRGNLQHPQHYINQQHQAMQYYHQMMSAPHHHMMYHHYQPSPSQQHSHHHQPQPQQPHIMYYNQHQQYPQQYIEIEHVADGYHQIPAGEQSYYHHSTAPAAEVTPGPSYLPPSGHQSQQEHPTSYINFVTPVYDQSELHHPVTEDHEDNIHVAENYPSEKHTRVIYKKKNHPRVQPGIVYHQPEIQKRPIVVAEQQEDSYNHKDDYHHHHQQQHQHQQQQISVPLHRTNPPFNYHVAVSTLSPTAAELHERHHPKRMVSLTKEQFDKARRIVMKSKRSRGSMKQDRPTMLEN